jgi:DNA-directed RNA polymerase specialized sigma24 family protein
MKSLWAGAVHGRFPLLHDRDNLWGLLIVLTTRKAADEKARSRRQKRGGGRVRGESAFDGNPATASDPGLGMILSEQPSPATLVELEDSLQQLLGRLDDETLRTIALWRMQGYTRDEIADQLGCARRTVARKLELIRKKWIAAD